MGLEFYSEANGTVYTICSNTFVLDITKENCTLLFVEDEYNSQFLYVQKYLNAYFLDKVVFYRLLKFFTRVVNLELRSVQNNSHHGRPVMNINQSHIKAKLDKYKNICECVFTDQYCYEESAANFPVGYNIYTHRIEYTHFEPILSFSGNISDGIDFYHGNKTYRLSPNLCNYFREDDFSVRAFDLLPKSKLYYYERDNIKVVEGNVYVDNEKCKIASFIFKKGCSLKDALAFSEKIKGD